MYKKILGHSIKLCHILYGLLIIISIIFIKNPLFLKYMAFIVLLSVLLWDIFGLCFLIPIENYFIYNDINYIKSYADTNNYYSILLWKYNPIITFILLIIKINLLNNL